MGVDVDVDQIRSVCSNRMFQRAPEILGLGNRYTLDSRPACPGREVGIVRLLVFIAIEPGADLATIE